MIDPKPLLKSVFHFILAKLSSSFPGQRFTYSKSACLNHLIQLVLAVLSHCLAKPKTLMMTQQSSKGYFLLKLPSFLLSQKQLALIWKPLSPFCKIIMFAVNFRSLLTSYNSLIMTSEVSLHHFCASFESQLRDLKCLNIKSSIFSSIQDLISWKVIYYWSPPICSSAASVISVFFLNLKINIYNYSKQFKFI